MHPLKLLYQSLPQLDRGEKIKLKVHGLRQRTRIDHPPNTITGKTGSAEFITNKISKKSFSLPLTPSQPYLLPQHAGKQGMGSVHHPLLLPLLRSHSPAAQWDPSHGIQYSKKCSKLSAFHGQQSSPNRFNMGHSSTGSVFYGQAVPAWALFSTGPQVPARGPG